MALFGRDSLLTSLMLLPLDPALALRHAADPGRAPGRRARRADTEEEPGRILHEMRFGPAARLGPRRTATSTTAPSTPPRCSSCCSASSRGWGASRRGRRSCSRHADRALDWIIDHGDSDGDGFVEYRAQDPSGPGEPGLEGLLGRRQLRRRRASPRLRSRSAEVQGYTYAAYRGSGPARRRDGERPRAPTRWRSRAADLKAAVQRGFWLPDAGWYAVGLDGDKRPIDALTSNIGHCLWTGIVDDDKAESVVRAPDCRPELFSGWGVRTLATSHGGPTTR